MWQRLFRQTWWRKLAVALLAAAGARAACGLVGLGDAIQTVAWCVAFPLGWWAMCPPLEDEPTPATTG